MSTRTYAQRLLVVLGFVLGALSLLAAAPTSRANPAADTRRRPTATPASTPIPGPTPQLPGTWKLVDSPNGSGNANELRAAAVVAANDAWAVGGTGSRTLITRWNGTRWNSVASPSGEPAAAVLSGVAVIGHSDAWAVGRSGGISGPNWRALITRWNGSAWNIVSSPSIGTQGTAELRAVAAVAANDVWAVGDYSTPATNWFNQPLIMHWDGVAWAIVPTPVFGSQASLAGITAVAANDVWAVGTALESNWRTLILHWDGVAWSRVASPNVGTLGNQLNAIAHVTSNDIWAVGSTNNGSSTLALRWNGAEWRVVPSPNGPNGRNRNSLISLAVIAANDIWAVGSSAVSSLCGGSDAPYYASYTLTAHWDGSAWAIAPSPSPGTGNGGCTSVRNDLKGVAGISSSNVLAVGSFFDGQQNIQTFKTLTERYSIP